MGSLSCEHLGVAGPRDVTLLDVFSLVVAQFCYPAGHYGGSMDGVETAWMAVCCLGGRECNLALQGSPRCACTYLSCDVRVAVYISPQFVVR